LFGSQRHYSSIIYDLCPSCVLCVILIIISVRHQHESKLIHGKLNELTRLPIVNISTAGPGVVAAAAMQTGRESVLQRLNSMSHLIWSNECWQPACQLRIHQSSQLGVPHSRSNIKQTRATGISSLQHTHKRDLIQVWSCMICDCYPMSLLLPCGLLGFAKPIIVNVTVRHALRQAVLVTAGRVVRAERNIKQTCAAGIASLQKNIQPFMGATVPRRHVGSQEEWH
jgi:hypothetical protein